MSKKAPSESDEKPIKFLLMGLDNSGKTSIALCLKKSTNLLSYCRLKPTPGVNVVNILEGDRKFALWDLGGQERYRIEYLENLNKYTKEVDKILFVIDVQDIERYGLALDYLKNVVDFIISNRIPVELSVFLHKFDPNLEELGDFSPEKITENLINKINEIIPADLSCKIFKTCIYSIFQKTLLS
ncbi:MAG: ADP-ribosylation factor-like protein [Candidatus Helarchaeota archaeon]